RLDPHLDRAAVGNGGGLCGAEGDRRRGGRGGRAQPGPGRDDGTRGAGDHDSAGGGYGWTPENAVFFRPEVHIGAGRRPGETPAQYLLGPDRGLGKIDGDRSQGVPDETALALV